MYRIKSGSIHGFTDTAEFIELLNNLPVGLEDFFGGSEEIFASRAPGRLDLMGGIADYSGSLVLQLPIAAATHVALELHNERTISIVSLPADRKGSLRSFDMSLADFQNGDQLTDYATARSMFKRESEHHWAAYVAGAFLVLMRERGREFKQGARILISSAVPEGKGVGSSAALEVAVMQAIIAAYAIDISTCEIAFLCQKVENLIAGAPCGVMDQMTAACGEADCLLELLCQPGELQGSIHLPDELAVWGIDSGIRHSVSGADYGIVRTAAFMGYRMIAEMAGLACHETESRGVVRISDDKWQGYLANIKPSEFERDYAPHLPQEMSGEEFLKQYKGINDSVTSVRADLSYPIFQATRHPIYEHARVKSFAETLKNWRGIEPAEQLGELMYQSHDSYSACRLGSTGTDALVAFVREAGIEAGLYGAKITGGGSGGTVAVLGHRDAAPSINAIVERYTESTGYQSMVISGSSPGAGIFGHLRLGRN